MSEEHKESNVGHELYVPAGTRRKGALQCNSNASEACVRFAAMAVRRPYRKDEQNTKSTCCFRGQRQRNRKRVVCCLTV